MPTPPITAGLIVFLLIIGGITLAVMNLILFFRFYWIIKDEYYRRRNR